MLTTYGKQTLAYATKVDNNLTLFFISVINKKVLGILNSHPLYTLTNKAYDIFYYAKDYIICYEKNPVQKTPTF